MISLIKDIEMLFRELLAKEPQPITNLLVEVRNKNGALHKNYPSGWKYREKPAWRAK